MIGSNGDDIKLTCRCGEVSRTTYHYKKVPYPNVTVLDVEYIKLNKEIEIFFEEPFGADVTITYHKESGRTDETRYNATEFHFMFDGFEGNEDFAVESDIHGQGGTTPIATVKTIVITKSTKKHTNH